MKKIIGLVLCVIVAFTCLTAGCIYSSAEEATNDNYKYVVMDDGTVELTEYSGNETVINIPSKIDGKNVTKVDNEVLVRSNITEINLPDTVYKNIDDILFYRDPELKAINVSEKNKYISSVDGVLFNKDKTVLYSFPRQKEDKEYTIPNGVKAIGQHAFCHAKNIEKVTLSSSVREIGAYAFEDSGLKEIKLNNKLKTIRKGAFSLARLAEIYIPESVKKMGNRMFGDSNRYIKIYGYKNSAAQKIAKKYNYKFYIVDPAAPKKTTVRGAKGKIKVNYKKVKRAKGFQVKAVSGKKKVVKTYKTEKSVRKAIKGLKKGTYKVKVRAFNTYNGEKIYSPWAVKTVKVK